MLPRNRVLAVALLAVLALAAPVVAADTTANLQSGTPDLKSVGPIAFGPDGILFIGDPQGSCIFAVATGDTKPAGTGPVKVEGLDEKIASLLGTKPQDLTLNDMAVNPASGNVYLAVSRGKGPDAVPVLLRVGRDGKISEVSLKQVKFSKAALSNATTRQRQEAITDLAYVDGRVLVAGLSNEEFASRLRSIPFPFAQKDESTSVEIFHGAHGRFETASPVRTFALFKIAGEDHLLAAYTCTPLVKVPLKDLKPNQHLKGTTVAELGNRNRPLDMVVYEKDGKNFVLLANSSRGLMKITTEGIDKIDPITKPVTGGGKAGLTYETLENYKNNIQQLDKLDKEHAVVVLRTEGGALNLETIPLP